MCRAVWQLWTSRHAVESSPCPSGLYAKKIADRGRETRNGNSVAQETMFQRAWLVSGGFRSWNRIDSVQGGRKNRGGGNRVGPDVAAVRVLWSDLATAFGWSTPRIAKYDAPRPFFLSRRSPLYFCNNLRLFFFKDNSLRLCSEMANANSYARAFENLGTSTL